MKTVAAILIILGLWKVWELIRDFLIRPMDERSKENIISHSTMQRYDAKIH